MRGCTIFSGKKPCRKSIAARSPSCCSNVNCKLQKWPQGRGHVTFCGLRISMKNLMLQVSIMSADGFKKKHEHRGTVRPKIYIKLWAVVQNWNFDLSAGNLSGELINLGFPRCETNSKLDFRGKRQGFDGKKPNWNALWRNISRDISKLVCEVRRTENCSCISIFAPFEATSPNCFNVFCKVLL